MQLILISMLVIAQRLRNESSDGKMLGRVFEGQASALDTFLAIALAVLFFAFLFIVRSYSRGLGKSPRELFLVLLVKFVEYSAFGLGILTFALYLSHDVGLTDIGAGSYVGTWMVIVSALIILVGAVCDVVGIRQTLLIGGIALLIGRFSLPALENPLLVSILGFLPLAFGVAITGPVLLVAIKRFTTVSGAALAFGLYYTLMNLGFATGGWIFDFVRGVYGDYSLIAELPLIGGVSVYQFLIAIAFVITLPEIIIILLMRDNVEMTESGIRVFSRQASRAKTTLSQLKTKVAIVIMETGQMLYLVTKEKRFWKFISALAIVTFIRIVSIHFLITFPTYGIRLFGDGAQVGNLYAILNPLIIVFLTPVFAALTSRVSSYRMLLWGCTISALSVWIATLSPDLFRPIINTGFGEFVFDRWLELPQTQWEPYYLALIIFIAVFSIGEAIWAPRLMQFTAEIAPSDKEGSYIALSYLPLFLGQFLAGPMSGLLLSTYLPAEISTGYPDHHMVWVWIGLVGAITPLGMLIFGRIFRRAENDLKGDLNSA
ncbi:MAG: hypothetical protein CMQ40_11515 [Gammaproteobacteria bacterium]|nr:hypothetical protein [Gammaproteobacteria bacterium]